MEIVTLDVEAREGSGKKAAKALRKVGRMPIVMYGKEQRHLSAESKAVFKALSGPARRNVIVEIIDAGGAKHHGILKELQYHPLTDELFHADFKEIALDEQLKSSVQINLNGVPEGVKLKGGTLRQHLTKVNVLALPEKTPTELNLDVSKLDVLQALTIGDISIGDGVEILAEDDARVASVAPRKMGPGGKKQEEGQGEAEAE